MENQKQDQEKSKFIQQAEENPSKSLNDWNDRLEENLETNNQGDTVADEKAKDFSEEIGSGDQSDQKED